MDVSNSESYPEEKIQEWLDKLRPFLYRLLDTWSVRRLQDETRDSYLDQANAHVQDLMNEMISESEDKNEILGKEIKHLIESLNKLSKELDIKIDLSQYEEFSLDMVKEKMNDDVHMLKSRKEEILNEVKQLRKKEYEICKKTGAKPIFFDKKVLNETDLEKFTNYLKIQENEKNRLEKEFLEIRNSIINMMNNLQSSPETEFRKQVINDPDIIMFTKENMQLLMEWETSLKSRIQQIEKLVKEKKDEMKALWTYLEEPLHYCQEFLKKYSDNSPSTYRAIENEIEKCKEKRAANIAKYVGKVRAELENFWDLCKYSEEQRNAFAPIHCQNFTDKLLSLHESEVQRLHQFYEQNKKIFDLVQDFESIIEQMKVLDRRAMDPDRLNNRGGQLLAEEKERKIANKRLPKIQEQFVECVQEYEKSHNHAFTLNGLTVDQYFIQVWNEYNKEKENIKSEVKEWSKKFTRRYQY